MGTLANQTDPATGFPNLPKADGDQVKRNRQQSCTAHAHPLLPQYNLYSFSYLEGQRLSACTCPGELSATLGNCKWRLAHLSIAGTRAQSTPTGPSWVAERRKLVSACTAPAFAPC